MEDVALVAGTQQNLSNLYSLDIYGKITKPHTIVLPQKLDLGESD